MQGRCMYLENIPCRKITNTWNVANQSFHVAGHGLAWHELKRLEPETGKRGRHH